MGKKEKAISHLEDVRWSNSSGLEGHDHKNMRSPVYRWSFHFSLLTYMSEDVRWSNTSIAARRSRTRKWAVCQLNIFNDNA
ncbi:hypothetical protein FRX31_006190 [Thalictrum thalictroides]|uniref:Uncharacterized protein n=1 Tax=Thalictrum thalictroides TaxID=46969 RepID=A0A7J6X4A3_THATH|nr:hypothetical protein FRX31_006190 [Thalictrum thalictroides]